MKVELLDVMGDDLTVVNAARVSYAKWKEEWDNRDKTLLEYLSVNNHWSPFTHAVVQFRVSASIAVCLLYTSPSPRDRTRSRMPSSA